MILGLQSMLCSDDPELFSPADITRILSSMASAECLAKLNGAPEKGDSNEEIQQLRAEVAALRKDLSQVLSILLQQQPQPR
jgi:hypothetical protein